MFELTKCTRECHNTSLHTITIAKEQAIRKYYWNTIQDVTLEDMAYGDSMINQGEDQSRMRDETEGDMM
jgi:hypothetical protein